MEHGKCINTLGYSPGNNHHWLKHVSNVCCSNMWNRVLVFLNWFHGLFGNSGWCVILGMSLIWGAWLFDNLSNQIIQDDRKSEGKWVFTSMTQRLSFQITRLDSRIWLIWAPTWLSPRHHEIFMVLTLKIPVLWAFFWPFFFGGFDGRAAASRQPGGSISPVGHQGLHDFRRDGPAAEHTMEIHGK